MSPPHNNVVAGGRGALNRFGGHACSQIHCCDASYRFAPLSDGHRLPFPPCCLPVSDARFGGVKDVVALIMVTVGTLAICKRPGGVVADAGAIASQGRASRSRGAPRYIRRRCSVGFAPPKGDGDRLPGIHTRSACQETLTPRFSAALIDHRRSNGVDRHRRQDTVTGCANADQVSRLAVLPSPPT